MILCLYRPAPGPALIIHQIFSSALGRNLLCIRYRFAVVFSGPVPGGSMLACFCLVLLRRSSSCCCSACRRKAASAAGIPDRCIPRWKISHAVLPSYPIALSTFTVGFHPHRQQWKNLSLRLYPRWCPCFPVQKGHSIWTQPLVACLPSVVRWIPLSCSALSIGSIIRLYQGIRLFRSLLH